MKNNVKICMLMVLSLIFMAFADLIQETAISFEYKIAIQNICYFVGTVILVMLVKLIFKMKECSCCSGP